MSILIKGMDMPKNCEECAFNYDMYRCMITSKSTMLADAERLSDCPLIELPDIYIDISKAFMQELADKICIKGDNECPS